MGVVPGTVKQNSGGLRKFSVTFFVDNQNGVSRFLRAGAEQGARRNFPSENGVRRACGAKRKYFLDGKIAASGRNF
jgi:hypothetical protein